MRKKPILNIALGITAEAIYTLTIMLAALLICLAFTRLL